MRPYMTLTTAVATPDPINLTTATGGIGNDISIKGFDGSDWVIYDGYNELNKRSGDQRQLKRQTFNDSGTPLVISGNASFPNFISYLQGDVSAFVSNPNQVVTAGQAIGFNVPQANSGIQWDALAGIDHREFHLIFESYNSWTIKATMSDGLVGPVTTVPASTGLSRVILAYGAASWDTTVTLELRSTTTSYIRPIYGYIPVPTRFAPGGGLLLGLARRFSGYT